MQKGNGTCCPLVLGLLEQVLESTVLCAFKISSYEFPAIPITTRLEIFSLLDYLLRYSYTFLLSPHPFSQANAVAPVSCPYLPASLVVNSSEHSHLFPRKIWQTSRTGPSGLDENGRKSIQSWVKINQKHRYEILTQYSPENYVKDRFLHRLDIEETFVDLQDAILRADLIRYLVLLGDGGLYSDIDTISLIPIVDWVPSAYVNNVNLVVGVEHDKLDGGRWGD